MMLCNPNMAVMLMLYRAFKGPVQLLLGLISVKYAHTVIKYDLVTYAYGIGMNFGYSINR